VFDLGFWILDFGIVILEHGASTPLKLIKYLSNRTFKH